MAFFFLIISTARGQDQSLVSERFDRVEVRRAICRVKTEADAAEKALSQASSAFERVRVLGTEGANFTQSADTRATIALVGQVTLDGLWHAVPSFPTVSEVWLRLLEAYGL